MDGRRRRFGEGFEVERVVLLSVGVVSEGDLFADDGYA